MTNAKPSGMLDTVKEGGFIPGPGSVSDFVIPFSLFRAIKFMAHVYSSFF